MDVTNYPVANISELEELIIDCAVLSACGLAPRPTLVLSPPGSGKTETAARLAARLGLAFVPFEVGLSVPEEIGGVPVRDPATGAVVRFALGPIKLACERPSLLLLDEVTRGDATRQGAIMTGVNERRWGDWKLHPGTVVMLAGNEPDSGGVFTILDALLNRCCVVRLRTTRSEIRSYLRGGMTAAPVPIEALPVGAVGAFHAERARLAELWADYSEGRNEMIAEDPPRGFAESGALFPSGRAIVHAIERVAARGARGRPIDDNVALTHVSGTVGREIGVLWHRLNELAGKLPTVAEINGNPNGAMIPADIESAIASLGLLPQLHHDALWIYLARYDEKFAEIKAAATRRCQGKLPKDPKALVAFNKLVARIHNALKR